MQADETLEFTGMKDQMYRFTESLKCGDNAILITAAANFTRTDVLVMGYTLTDHECGTKGATGTVLCLPKTACAEACDALGDDCSGINVHFELPQCVLIVDECTDSTEKEAWQFFAKTTGGACTHADDFKQTVGKITVTSRVHTNVEYVLTPGETSSLELTNPDGTSFTYNGQLSRDRITVIDCGGSCGLSPSSDALSLPAHSADIMTWNSIVPFPTS